MSASTDVGFIDCTKVLARLQAKINKAPTYLTLTQQYCCTSSRVAGMAPQYRIKNSTSVHRLPNTITACALLFSIICVPGECNLQYIIYSNLMGVACCVVVRRTKPLHQKRLATPSFSRRVQERDRNSRSKWCIMYQVCKINTDTDNNSGRSARNYKPDGAFWHAATAAAVLLLWLRWMVGWTPTRRTQQLVQTTHIIRAVTAV